MTKIKNRTKNRVALFFLYIDDKLYYVVNFSFVSHLQLVW